ncbi:MAG: homocysteine S-methyltransferase family protein, partial [Candidatus Electryoneaceae bacterium]|nr:homocysteine S-methyltransferase family protein [Candidatus Electryoneaceae bacterium]
MANTITEDHRNRKTLEALLKERILVVDGAMGTALEQLGPSVDDFGGETFHGCYEMLNLHAPNLVTAVHRNYIEAGADLIKTNSFNGSPIVMDEYGVADMSQELARRAAELAVSSVERWSQGRPVFIMGSMGPGTRSITVTGGVTFDRIFDAYRIYATGLLEGGADLLLLETMQDTLNVKAALLGIQVAQDDLGRDAPMALSVTIEAGGTMLAGQNIEALYHTVAHFDLFSIGLNCATGPVMMTDHLRTLAGLSRFPVSVWPNAALPDHSGDYSEGPAIFHEIIGNFARKGWIN